MPPYCAQHRTHHTYPGEHGDMRRAAFAAQKDAERRDRAAQIAADVIVAEHRRDSEVFPRDWDDVQRIAAAAALQALTEKETTP